jgi:hypothetical protein
MDGLSQLVDLIAAAVAILIALLLLAFTIGRFFRDYGGRKRIMFGAIGLYVLVLVAYFGFIAFILSGDLN